MAELLGGGAIVALLTGTIVFAAQWGDTLRRVEDHVDPDKHGLIVLAGNLETGQKIVIIETEINHVKDELGDVKETQEDIRDDVSDIKGDIRVLLELARRAIPRTTPPVAATPTDP